MNLVNIEQLRTLARSHSVVADLLELVTAVSQKGKRGLTAEEKRHAKEAEMAHGFALIDRQVKS